MVILRVSLDSVIGRARRVLTGTSDWHDGSPPHALLLVGTT